MVLLVTVSDTVQLIVGAARSCFQVIVLDNVDVLPQTSFAEKVLVCDLVQLPVT